MKNITVNALLEGASEIQQLKQEVVTIIEMLMAAMQHGRVLKDGVQKSESLCWTDDAGRQYRWCIRIGDIHSSLRSVYDIELQAKVSDGERFDTEYSYEEEPEPDYVIVRQMHLGLEQLVAVAEATFDADGLRGRLKPFLI